jgi:hypothetical protein
VGPEIKYQERHRVLILKLDRQGKEVTRGRLVEGGTPRLFNKQNGYVVVDNSLSRTRRGVRLTLLDHDLKVLSQRIVGGSQSYFDLEAALDDGEDGFFLAGYRVIPPASRGRTSIAYLNDKGEIVAEKTFGMQLPYWAPVAFVRGDRSNEPVLLQRGESGDDIKLMKLRYSK